MYLKLTAAGATISHLLSTASIESAYMWSFRILSLILIVINISIGLPKTRLYKHFFKKQ